MYKCEKCEDKGFITDFPIHPPTKVMEESDPKKQTEMFNDFTEYCVENMSHPCPDCKPLEYKVYKLELKCNKLERWFLKCIENGRTDNCEACLGLSSEEIIAEEVPMVEHILEDEMWLESERRQAPVDPKDPEVQKHVIEVIKKDGEILREEAVDKLRKKKRGRK